MNDPVLVRRKIREVLALVPDRRFSERMILDAINRLLPEPVDFVELRSQLNWNHEKGFIDYALNADEERDEWFLTARGKTKEGVR